LLIGTEALRTSAIAFAALGGGLTWLALRTAAIPVSSPERLIAELRLAQIAALLLALVAGAYVGIAVAHETRPGVGLDIALAVGFFIVAAATLIRDPIHALTMLALAFAAHAIVDVAHRPGWPLPDSVAPPWYSIGCAVYDVYIGALCYWPILRR
jgi:predicted MPP superfamily phosphohydrolase